MQTFELHPQLAADTFPLGKVGSIHVLLHRTALVPWFILVPETRAIELHDLPPLQRAELNALAERLGRFLCQSMDCEKLNIAAICNVVSQLHLHVMGRRREDALWPRVVWGNLPPDGALRTAEDAALLAARLRLAQCL